MPSKGSGLRGVRQQEPSILTQFVTSVWNARAHLAPQIADTSNQTACMQAGKGLVGDPLLIFGPRVTVRSCSKEECTAVLPAVWCTAALQGVPQARCGCECGVHPKTPSCRHDITRCARAASAVRAPAEGGLRFGDENIYYDTR